MLGENTACYVTQICVYHKAKFYLLSSLYIPYQFLDVQILTLSGKLKILVKELFWRKHLVSFEKVMWRNSTSDAFLPLPFLLPRHYHHHCVTRTTAQKSNRRYYLQCDLPYMTLLNPPERMDAQSWLD